MSLSKAISRRLGGSVAGLLLLGLSLAGCGFQPLYGAHTIHTDADLAGIRVDPIHERAGQLLEIALRDGFNPENIGVEARSVLVVILGESVGDFAIRSDGTTSRQIYNLTAAFKLTDLKTHKLLLEGHSRSNNSYDVAENEYSVVVARDSAEKRAVRQLSDDIRARVAMFFRQKQTGS